MRSRSQCGQNARVPTRAPSRAPRPRIPPTARRPRAHRTAPCSFRLLAYASLDGLEPGGEAQLLVALAAREDGERLVVPAAAVEPALDESCDRRVELLARDAPEQRLADLRIRPEAAAHEDVVRLHPLAVGVARRRALEPEVGDPVLRARVRAAVELQAERADRVSEALLEVLDQPAEALLRLGHREVAVRLARAADRAAAHVVDREREADALQLGDDPGDALVRDVGDEEVLLSGDAHVGARALHEVGDGDHLVARDQPEVHGHADVAEPRLLLRVDA